MPLEYYFLALLSSSAIILVFKIVKHVYDVNIFYRKLQDLFNAYYAQYPAQHDEHFAGIVDYKSDALWRFWVNDMNEFILEPDMLQELYAGASLYTKTREAEQAERDLIQLECAWCDNTDAGNFLWFETDEKTKTGTIQCQECFATCPIATYEECLDLMKPVECDCGCEEN